MPTPPTIRCGRPPLVELVLGVQFNPVLSLQVGQLASFWKTLGDSWPDLSLASPLEQQFELFGSPKPWGSAGSKLRFSLRPEWRVQIRNRARTRMVQMQNGRFHYNWMRGASEEYPRFAGILPEFQEVWTRFRGFLAQAGLPELEPNQWEVTYVNHIPRGGLWESGRDWPRVLPGLFSRPELTGLTCEGAVGQWHFEIDEQMGRLHVEVEHGIEEAAPHQELIVLKLTARGPLNSVVVLTRGLELGRRAAGEALYKLSSAEARKGWELTLEQHD